MGKHSQIREGGARWHDLKLVVDAPFFADSRMHRGIQVADIVAYAVRRYLDLDSGKRAGSHEEKNLLRIYDRFDRHEGRLHGLRHFVPQGTCDCIICAACGKAPLLFEQPTA